jgi:hypothetical protein
MYIFFVDFFAFSWLGLFNRTLVSVYLVPSTFHRISIRYLISDNSLITTSLVTFCSMEHKEFLETTNEAQLSHNTLESLVP